MYFVYFPVIHFAPYNNHLVGVNFDQVIISQGIAADPDFIR